MIRKGSKLVTLGYVQVNQKRLPEGKKRLK